MDDENIHLASEMENVEVLDGNAILLQQQLVNQQIILQPDQGQPPAQQVVAADIPNAAGNQAVLEVQAEDANLQIVESHDGGETVESDDNEPLEVVASAPTTAELAQMMEDQRSSDFMAEMRQREDNLEMIDYNDDENMLDPGVSTHNVVDYMRDLNLSFRGISPIEPIENPDNLVVPIVKDDYTWNEIYKELGIDTEKPSEVVAKKTMKQIVKTEGKQPAVVKNRSNTTGCTLGMATSSTKKNTVCTCVKCIAEIEFDTKSEDRTGCSSRGSSGGGHRSNGRKEAMEAPIHYTEKDDIFAMPRCKESRVFCNCGYCTVRRALSAAGHHDNNYHRTKCVYCKFVTKKNDPKLTPIVAVFHVFQDVLFDMEDLNEVQVELIKLLAAAIKMRVSVFYPTIAYIDREYKVVAGGGKSRRFVLAIRSDSIALKLKSLVGRLDLEFMIVPGHGHEFEDQMQLQKMGSLQAYVIAASEKAGKEMIKEPANVKAGKEVFDKPGILKKVIKEVKKEPGKSKLDISTSSSELLEDYSDSDYDPEDGDDYEEEFEHDEDEDESDEKSPESNEDEEESEEEEDFEDGMDNPAKNTSHDFKENVSPSPPFKVVATQADHLATQAEHLATQAEHLANQAEHLVTQEKAQKRRHVSEDISEGDNDCIVVEVRPPVHRRRISGPNLLPPWNSLFDAPKDRKPLAEHGGNNLMGSSTSSMAMAGPSSSSTPAGSGNKESNSTGRGNSSSTRRVDKDVDVNMDEEPEIEILD